MKKETESKQMDRYEGAMIGVAVGDALGAPLEFMSANEISYRYGTVREMIGGGWLSVKPGEVTDDTQMTLAVAEGIVANQDSTIEPLMMVGANFLRWYRTNPKDVGGTCAAVLAAIDSNETQLMSDWHDAARHLKKRTHGQTAGNGALMRTVYPALYFHNAKEAEERASQIGSMTHWHNVSDQTVRLYTLAVNTIANSDVNQEEAKEMLEQIMQPIRGMAGNSTTRPTGYSLDSLVCALDAIRATDSFEDALVCAVNLGGDADTIGAITGGLAGAIYGASQIPLRWTNQLANEPNRRTVALFHDSKGPAASGNANTLLIRLIDLAQIAFEHR